MEILLKNNIGILVVFQFVWPRDWRRTHGAAINLNQ